MSIYSRISGRPGERSLTLVATVLYLGCAVLFCTLSGLRLDLSTTTVAWQRPARYARLTPAVRSASASQPRRLGGAWTGTGGVGASAAIPPALADVQPLSGEVLAEWDSAVRAASDLSSLTAVPLPELDAATLARREALRDVCAEADAFIARAEVPVDDARASEALSEGLMLARHLPRASLDALADLEADVLKCVSFWARVTGRQCAQVQVKLLRESLCSVLHLDHVEARAICTLYGRGTEWVVSPGPLHAAASLANVRGGNSLGDALKRIVETTCGPLRAAKERELVLIRGTLSPQLLPWESRLHRSPSVDACCGEWRLLVKVDEVPGPSASPDEDE